MAQGVSLLEYCQAEGGWQGLRARDKKGTVSVGRMMEIKQGGSRQNKETPYVLMAYPPHRL